MSSLLYKHPFLRYELSFSNQETNPVTLVADDGCWHPVAYMSRKLSSAERNYTAAERETLAVVHALKCWRMYLFDHFDVITDNTGVFYLRTKRNQNVKLDGQNFWLILISMCIIDLELRI